MRPAELTRENMKSAIRSLNLGLQTFGNRGLSLWEIALNSITLVQGTSVYSLPTNIVNVLDVYIETSPGGGTPIDRILLPISRSDYASYPNKTDQAPPTVYWFDRINAPTMTVWQPPDGAETYTLKYYTMLRVQDAAATMGQTVDIPYLFLEALCSDLAARLAQKYAPARFQEMKQEAGAQFIEAATENREYVQTFITPDLSGYYR